LPVLDLGETPIANALQEMGAPPAPRYPLNIVFCPECSLVQLGYELDASVIFDDEYPYYSSVSDALVRHAGEHAARLIASRRLDSSSIAVEVASNDGYLLQHFQRAGVRTLGIDPSPGPAEAARAIGIETIVGFFGRTEALAIRASHGPADVIVANNVMAHVPDLDDFVGGFAELLADDGVLTVENPYVRDLVEHVEFDTIYHEHYCYYSCTSVDALMRRHGLFLNDVEYFPNLHGGTLRWYVGRRDERSSRCRAMLEDEHARGLDTYEYYRNFAARVEECQATLRSLLSEWREQGRVVAAYGAAAKGATLLNSTGITRPEIAYVVDRNSVKQGRMMPGCELLIRPVETLLEEQPDDVVLLAWNFAEEIVAQQGAYLERGGRFCIPVPSARVITADQEASHPDG
jgi:SAM-dependent methyltransferase